MIEETRHNKYLETDGIIKEAYNQYARKHNLRPTQQEIADICDMSRKTVNEHLKGNPFFMGPERKKVLKRRVEKGCCDKRHLRKQHFPFWKDIDEYYI